MLMKIFVNWGVVWNPSRQPGRAKEGRMWLTQGQMRRDPWFLIELWMWPKTLHAVPRGCDLRCHLGIRGCVLGFSSPRTIIPRISLGCYRKMFTKPLLLETSRDSIAILCVIPRVCVWPLPIDTVMVCVADTAMVSTTYIGTQKWYLIVCDWNIYHIWYYFFLANKIYPLVPEFSGFVPNLQILLIAVYVSFSKLTIEISFSRCFV